MKFNNTFLFAPKTNSLLPPTINLNKAKAIVNLFSHLAQSKEKQLLRLKTKLFCKDLFHKIKKITHLKSRSTRNYHSTHFINFLIYTKEYLCFGLNYFHLTLFQNLNRTKNLNLLLGHLLLKNLFFFIIDSAPNSRITHLTWN